MALEEDNNNSSSCSSSSNNKGFFQILWEMGKGKSENVQPQPQPQKEAEKKVEESIKTERESEPCWKKKAGDAGFLSNVKDHVSEFVSTPMDQHRICLKKTFRGFGNRIRRSAEMTEGNNLGVRQEVNDSHKSQTTSVQ